MDGRKRVVAAIDERYALTVDQDLIVEVPTDGIAHMGRERQVFAVRAGEFTLVVTFFPEGREDVRIM